MTVVLYIIVSVILIVILLDLFIFSNKKNKLDVAVIVEPRKHKHLVKVVKNIIENVPKYTTVQIFHGTTNEEFVKYEFERYIKSGKVVLVNLNVDNLDIEKYSELLTSTDFWNKVCGENVLIFQTDSCICSNVVNDIDEFIKYDYVGGPGDLNAPVYFQNGGFSFRKKSAMLRIIKNSDESTNRHPEDVFYTTHNRDKLNMAPHDVAKKFSVESQFYNKPYGVHKPWLWLDSDKMSELKDKCSMINDIEQFTV